MKVLKGSTWEHDRGFAPLEATSARFAHTHPEIQIKWTKRSLQEFAEFPLEKLAEQYDLIVLDHPFMGTVARQGILVPLEEQLPSKALETFEKESVGQSHQSYLYRGHQWALAIDAAAQVAAYRPDLLAAEKVEVPRSWDEVFELARIRPGFVALPLLPVDAWGCFVTLCANSGESPFSVGPQEVVTEEAGALALQRLKSLADHSPPECLGWNPIAVWERMATTNQTAYCPLGFGYSNYSRPGYRERIVHYTNIPAHKNGGPIGAILGGAGLGISSHCRELEAAVEYVQWVAGAECQRSLYFEGGGQPGNRRAWTDPEVNSASTGFFESTLPTLERAYLRPRFDGFIDFQAGAAEQVSTFLQGKETERKTLRSLNALYQRFQ